MQKHVTFTPLSDNWFYGVFASSTMIALGCLFLRKKTPAQKERFRILLGSFMLLEISFTHLFLAFVEKTWAISESLPLHMCRMSFLIAGFALLTKKQILYEWSVYLGSPGGLHSILTPELTQGTHPWILFNYYFSHSMLMFVPLALSVYYHFIPRKKGALYIFGLANVLVIITFLSNYLLDSNYMYLAQAPLVDNPFIIGPWPWYIIGLELAGALHIFVMDLVFRVTPNFLQRHRGRSRNRQG